VLQGYFDESGISTEAASCVLAGFVGTTQKWSVFESSWMRATESVCFHAKRFFGRDDKGRRLDQYKEWSDARAERYLDRLLDAIISRVQERALIPVGAAVDVRAFGALTEQQRRYLTGLWIRKRRTISTGAPTKPYFAVFPWCIARAAKCARHSATVDFVFDDSPNFVGLARQQFHIASESVQPDFRRRLGTLAFKRSPDVAGLQAADLLAYCVYQRMSGGTRKPELARALNRLEAAVLVKHSEMALLDHEAIDRVLRDPDAARAIRMMR
jgi:hypothetical protein